jgi:hypothetical protein
MSESIWWPDEAWYERKALPLGFITLSFRQLTTIAISFLVAFLFSLPFQFPIAGFSFGGRAAAFCLVFGVGYVISSRRVKMLPVELQAFYFLRTKGIAKLGASLRNPLISREDGTNSRPKSEQTPIVQEMIVEDFNNPIPMIISDRVKGVGNETQVLLLLDDEVRAKDTVSSQKPRYRLSYLPLPKDVRTHTLTVKLDGSSESLATVRLSLVGRGC